MPQSSGAGRVAHRGGGGGGGEGVAYLQQQVQSMSIASGKVLYHINIFTELSHCSASFLT